VIKVLLLYYFPSFLTECVLSSLWTFISFPPQTEWSNFALKVQYSFYFSQCSTSILPFSLIYPSPSKSPIKMDISLLVILIINFLIFVSRWTFPSKGLAADYPITWRAPSNSQDLHISLLIYGAKLLTHRRAFCNKICYNHNLKFKC